MNISSNGAKILFPIFLLLTVLTAWGPVTDHDFGFNVAAGRIFFSEGSIPEVDHLSVAGEGRLWINRLWGFQATLYLIHESFGLAGVSGFVALLTSAAFAFLILASGKQDHPVTYYVFLIALFLVQFRLRARPEILSFFFLAVVYYLLELFQRDEKKGAWAVCFLPLIQILWVNIHGLYILGIMLQGLLLLTWMIEAPLSRFVSLSPSPSCLKKKKILASVLLLSCAASFINPFGWEGVAVPFRQFQMMNATSFFSQVTELVPTHLLLPGMWENDKGFLIALLIFLGLGIAAFIKPARGLPLYPFLVFLAFLYLALKSNRNLALFALVAAPAMASQLSEKPFFGARGLVMDYRRVMAIFVILIFVRLLAPFPSFLFVHPLGSGLCPEETFALRPAHFMLENKIPGPVFPTDLRDGNLLLWKGIKPVYDGRLEVFGEDFFRRYHDETLPSEKNFMEAVDRYKCQAVLVRHHIDNRYPTISRFVPLRAGDLFRNPEWALVFFDTSFCLFVRRDAVEPSFLEEYGWDFTKETAMERLLALSSYYQPEEEGQYLEETARIAMMLTVFGAPEVAKKLISRALKEGL